ncbi:MAG TPA: M4 family metallopeptidase [Vicinamibacterales bacterium]|nr:M4 family metallopeptidase [Vicinamibacterales bacterium]
MRLLVPKVLGAFVAVVLLLQQSGRAQVPQAGDGINAGRVTFSAVTQGAVAETNGVISRMRQAGELTSVRIQDDPQIAGRQTQTLQQVYKGIPVEGGSVSLQTAGPATVSVFGTVFNAISLDTSPAIAPVDAARIIEKASNAFIAFGASPTLVVFPSPVGTFALTYKATVENAITYYVDAMTGDIVRVVDEKNYETGLGTGTLGEPKKMATTLVDGTYRTKDTLRPAGISTYDTGGSAAVLSRMENGNTATDSDLASNATNTWTNGYVVDAHSNTGLTYDYFFRQHNWSGLDGSNRPMSAIVHSGLINNAYFIGAPFGPNRNGEMVFGRTTANVPFATLDIAGHELMHGVTFFSMSNRTGSGFVNILYTVLGPTSFVFNGSTFPCSTTTLVDGLGNRRPFLCSGGRYVLGASHGGAINEAVSDMFGTSVEFFHQPAGSGPLKADYEGGEDLTGLGPTRSLRDPASISIRHDSGTIGYPDHVSKMLNYALVVTGGTATNPTSVTLSPVAFANGGFLFLFNNQGAVDGGGVHLNSTVLSHAFYLAIEGGRNATSGVTVNGVGGANRVQIEKVFFRAETQLMPNNANFQTAAAVAIQAAVDLYGAGSPVTQAVTQAMTAVGLR